MKTASNRVAVGLWIVAITISLVFGCAPHVSARPAEQPGVKPYSREVFVAMPEPGVHCYIVIDGYPATSAISCLRVP